MSSEVPNRVKALDSKSPFYMGGADNPGLLLTNILLKGESNYDNWVKAMMNALKAKNKLGFVTGAIKRPVDENSEEGQMWDICNSTTNGWILNTVDPELQPFIKFFDTAKGLWDDLAERYAVANIPRLYHLKSSIPTAKQQELSVTTYYMKLRAIWDELETSSTTKLCECGDKCAAVKQMREEAERDKVYQFLMGLDDAVFGNIRTQILNLPEFPTVNKAYAVVTGEEKS